MKYIGVARGGVLVKSQLYVIYNCARLTLPMAGIDSALDINTTPVAD